MMHGQLNFNKRLYCLQNIEDSIIFFAIPIQKLKHENKNSCEGYLTK